MNAPSRADLEGRAAEFIENTGTGLPALFVFPEEPDTVLRAWNGNLVMRFEWHAKPFRIDPDWKTDRRMGGD